MKIQPYFKYIIIGSLFLLACTQVDVSGLDPDIFTNAGGGGGGGGNELCKDVDSSFSTKVLPLLNDKCNGTGCHGSGSSGGNLNLDDGDNIKGDGESGVIGNIKDEGAINAFSAAQSALLLKPLAAAEGGQGGTHTGGEIFANTVDPDYKTIFCWIEDGAKNDLSDSQCTFGEHVYPIFRVRGCINGNCHDSDAPRGNMNLSQGSVRLLTDNPNGTATFGDADLQPVVAAGDLTSLLLTKPSQTNGVSHGVGVDGAGSIFPNTQDPDYEKIKCWLDEGANNN